MTVAYEECPFCAEVFRGESSPRTVHENAFLLCSNHVWAKHADKMYACPRQSNGIVKSFWRKDGTCSYCGSISAETFLLMAEGGSEIVPTDKDYKVYVGGIGGVDFKFDHLNQDQMRRFVDLYNEKKLNMPEAFYVLPFFMARKV